MIARMLTCRPRPGTMWCGLMRHGKAEYYTVADPLLLRSLTAFNDTPMAPWMKVFIWPKQVLTAGATMTAEFVGRNMARDTMEAATTAREHFIPLVDTLRGAAESLTASPLAQDLMMAGSYFHGGLFHQGDYEATLPVFRETELPPEVGR